jgi:large subunit ribosomal protein L4
MLHGGGHAFAKKARDFSTKLPRKVIQMGMRVALSAKVSENALGIVEALDWPSGKTRDLEKRIKELGWQKTLLVTGSDTLPDALVQSSRALDYIKAITAANLTIHEAVKWERIVLDFSAVEFFERNLKKSEIDALVGM